MTRLASLLFVAIIFTLLMEGLDSKPCGQNSPAMKDIFCRGYGYLILAGVLLPILFGYVCANQRCCKKTGLVAKSTFSKIKTFYKHSLQCKLSDEDGLDEGSPISNFCIEEESADSLFRALHRRHSSCPEVNLRNMSSSIRVSHESIVSDIQPLNSVNLGIKLAPDTHAAREYITSIENVSIASQTEAQECSESDESLASSHGSPTDEQKEVLFPMVYHLPSPVYQEQLLKSSPVGLENVTSMYFSSALTQTDGGEADLDKFRPKPIFSTSWQAIKGFQSAGGSLTIPDSDVRLEMPANAVPPAVYVDVVVATYTDLPEVRDVLHIPQDEYIMSPMVELHASGSTHFDKPVQLFLPHGLPLSFSEDHVNIYHIETGENGTIQVKPVPSRDVYGQMLKRNDIQISSQSGTYRDEETGVEYGPGYFQLMPSGELIVSTTRFCGYVCTACKEYVDRVPQLHLLATSSPVQLVEDQWQVEVFLHLWDRKITIRDFQRDVVKDRVPVEKTLDVVENFLNSVVNMKLTLCGANRANWHHALRVDSDQPIFPVSQRLPMKQLLHCRAKDSPKQKQWLMETLGGPETSPAFQCYIDVSNVETAHAASGTEGSEAKEEITLYLKDNGHSALGNEEDPDSASRRKRVSAQRKQPEQSQTNTGADTSRQTASVAAASSPPARPVSVTPEGVQEEGGIASYLLFGDGRASEPQACSTSRDPTRQAAPGVRNSSRSAEESNILPNARMDNLKSCRVSNPQRRPGEEHDENQHGPEPALMLVPCSENRPAINISVSCPGSLVQCTSAAAAERPDFNLTSGGEIDRDQVTFSNNAQPQSQVTDTTNPSVVCAANRAREERVWNCLENSDMLAAREEGNVNEEIGAESATSSEDEESQVLLLQEASGTRSASTLDAAQTVPDQLATSPVPPSLSNASEGSTESF